MHYREPHLTENWTESFRDMEHPEMKHSFLWYISKAVGKTTIAPPELAKYYLTDPTLQKQSTLYTFSKEELLKLRDDVFANPEQYERLFKTYAYDNEPYNA